VRTWRSVSHGWFVIIGIGACQKVSEVSVVRLARSRIVPGGAKPPDRIWPRAPPLRTRCAGGRRKFGDVFITGGMGRIIPLFLFAVLGVLD